MYPQQVDVNESSIQKLTDTLKRTYKDIVKEIETATDFGVANRKEILRQIEKHLEDLGVDVQKFIEEELPKHYKLGADDAVKQLKNTGADVAVSEGFNRVHKDAIAALVDDSTRAFGETLTGVSRSANLLLGKAVREEITQALAKGVAAGEARLQVRKTIKALLQEQGLSALVDKGGKTWTLDRYADMLLRTKAVEARNRGMVNRLVENGYDLVQVSSHGTEHYECAIWEGKILSLRGESKGYPTVAQAERAGLFHPNCKHAINTVIPRLAKLTQAYDPGTKEYGKPGASLTKGYTNLAQSKLVEPARKFDKQFKEKLENAAKNGGWQYSHGPLKKAGRVAEKVLYDYNGNLFAIKDINRSVLFINDPNDDDEFVKMVEAIKVEFGSVSTIKVGINRTQGYANNMINIETSYGAQAEIQVTTVEMWKAKKVLGGDELYHEWRISADQDRDAWEKMTKLYEKARQETDKRLKG